MVKVEEEEMEIGWEDGIYEKIEWEKVGGKEKLIESEVNDWGVGEIVW